MVVNIQNNPNAVARSHLQTLQRPLNGLQRRRQIGLLRAALPFEGREQLHSHAFVPLRETLKIDRFGEAAASDH